MDEYKQMRDSLNRAANLRQPDQNPVPQQQQAAAVAPESHIHEAQRATILEQPQREEPAHEDHHQEHQDTDSTVMWGSLGSLYYQDKMHTVSIETYKSNYFFVLS